MTITLQAAWAYLGGLALAVLAVIELDRWLPLFGQPRYGGGEASAGLGVILMLLLAGIAIAGLFASALSSWLLQRRLGSVWPPTPFLAAAVGVIAASTICLVGLPDLHFSPPAVGAAAAGPLLVFLIAGALAAGRPALAHGLAPGLALFLVGCLACVRLARSTKTDASQRRIDSVAAALSSDDVGAIDRLTAEGREIDVYLPYWVNEKPTGAALDRLLDSRHQSPLLDTLRAARAGKDPASASRWPEVRKDDDVDAALLIFCAARNLPVGFAATAKRAPNLVPGAFDALLGRGDFEGARRLLAGLGVLDDRGRLIQGGLDPALRKALDRHPEFAARLSGG